MPVIPLSFAQRRLWFLGRLQGPSAAYNAPVVLHLDAEPDAGALGAALVDVVERHEVLRTVLKAGADGEPYQHVLDASAVPGLAVTPCAPGEVDAAVRAFVRRAIDVTVEPPLRARLLRHGDGTCVLVLLVHHVATDGWSVGPLLRDLGRAYEARLAGRAPDWAPLPVQYTDYSLWQHELLGDPADPDSLAREQLEHWRAALAGAPAVISLPADRPRPAEPSGRGATVTARLDAAAHGALLGLARTHRASLTMVARAALAAALSAVGAGEDVVIGAPVAGRPDEDLYELVGFFVNSLALRTDLSGDPSLGELLRRVREADLAAYEHAELPFDLLVEHLSPERALGHHPFFQVMLTVDAGDGPAGPVSLGGGVGGRLAEVDLDTAKFDLTWYCAQRHAADGRPDGLEIGLQYASDLFDEETARLLLDVYGRALAAFARDPERRTGQLDLLTPEEAGALAARRERLEAAPAQAPGRRGGHPGPVPRADPGRPAPAPRGTRRRGHGPARTGARTGRAAAGADPAVRRAAGAVAGGPDRGPVGHVQRAAGAEAGRGPRAGTAGGGAGGPPGAAPGAADGVRGRGRRAVPAGRAGARRAAGGGRLRPRGAGGGDRGARAGALRPGGAAAVPGPAAAAGGRHGGAGPAGAPHRHRRLVAGSTAAGPRAGVRGPVHGPGPRVAAPAGAVRRLRAVAARAAGRSRRAGGPLAGGAGGDAGPYGAARRPAAPRRALGPGRSARGAARRPGPPGTGGAGAHPAGQLLHGGPGGARGGPVGGGRGDGPGDRDARGGPPRPGPARARGLLRQLPGAAHRSVRGPRRGRVRRPGPGRGPGRLRPPGPALRPPGGAARGARTGPGRAPVLPGDADRAGGRAGRRAGRFPSR